MSVLLEVVRVAGLRCLENIEVKLERTTVLTGMNNSGKTSFLKALQVALGNRLFISQDDFAISGSTVSENIIVDLKIVPMKAGLRCEAFSDDWEMVFTTDRIRIDDTGAFVPFRTVVTFDTIKNTYRTRQFILKRWPEFVDDGIDWFKVDNGTLRGLGLDEMPFYYMDAQRDILEDIKLRNSYLGKMLSKIEYSEAQVQDIESQIRTLNETAVSSSAILSNIKATLKGLDTAMDTHSEGVEITPFTKKIRDLNKGLTIHYRDSQESLPMEYHGMGTRSWSSLLTLKAFVSLLAVNSKQEGSVFFPILAIEEPEAHLHPNAQKKLFRQMEEIDGQVIISTHSPYIPASAELCQIRSFYKGSTVSCGSIEVANLKSEDVRKIARQVVNTRGEIFFSRAIVLIEGETEAQALPILAEKYFTRSMAELGLDFVGVGGHGSYLPFLRFADGLNIPWFIFSDAEAEIKRSVQGQVTESGTQKAVSAHVVFLDDGKDFEAQLLEDGYRAEIKKAMASLAVYTNELHRAAQIRKIDRYDDMQLLRIIKDEKTKYGPAVADQIVQSGKALPPKVVDLFDKMATYLRLSEVEE